MFNFGKNKMVNLKQYIIMSKKIMKPETIKKLKKPIKNGVIPMIIPIMQLMQQKLL